MQSGTYGLNIRDKTEGSEYYLAFLAPETGKWFTVQKYLGKAVYKRFGKDGISKDRLVGDDLEAIHIATSGSEVWVSDLQIANVDKPVKESSAEESVSSNIKRCCDNKHLASLRYWGSDYHYAHKTVREDAVFLAGLTACLVHDTMQVIQSSSLPHKYERSQ